MSASRTGSSRSLRAAAVTAVVLVPLAFAGLFIGALSDADNALDRIPAAVVNNDKLINQTAADGTETPVFAGRALVTELTSDDAAGFDWRITNEDDAKEALASGEVYAILTVPSDFSESILSVSGDDPVAATIDIQTDDAHTYLSGSVAQVVGEQMVATFGKEITAQYLEGLYSGFDLVGESLGEAADGAGELADGATELASGLDELADGAAQSADGADQIASGVAQSAAGANQFSSGVSQYSKGVDQLATGLGTLSRQTNGIGGIGQGIAGVSQLSAAISGYNAALQANPNDPAALAGLNAVAGQLAAVAGPGTPLVQGAAGLPALESGIDKIAAGASQASAGSPQLRSGASELASGLGQLAVGTSKAATGADQLADGAAQSADGASQLADGAGELSTGLREGADEVPAFEGDAAKRTADVAAEPVTMNVATDHPVPDVGQGIATFFIPLGLWIGALATFLVLRPLSARALASSASTGRLALSMLSRAAVLALAQAVVLTALLHAALGVEWTLLPATLGFSAVMALAFTAFHFVLTLALGRSGLVVSLLALAVQMAATGSPYPIEVLAGPFQAISPFLPLSYGVSGMQALISGGDVAGLGLAVVALIAFGVGSVLLGFAALARLRRATALAAVAS